MASKYSIVYTVSGHSEKIIERFAEDKTARDAKVAQATTAAAGFIDIDNNKVRRDAILVVAKVDVEDPGE